MFHIKNGPSTSFEARNDSMEIKAIPANKSADNQKVVEGAKEYVNVLLWRPVVGQWYSWLLESDDTVEHHSDKFTTSGWPNCLTPLNFLTTATHSHQSDRCFPFVIIWTRWSFLLVALPISHILDDLPSHGLHLQRRLWAAVPTTSPVECSKAFISEVAINPIDRNGMGDPCSWSLLKLLWAERSFKATRVSTFPDCKTYGQRA